MVPNAPAYVRDLADLGMMGAALRRLRCLPLGAWLRLAAYGLAHAHGVLAQDFGPLLAGLLDHRVPVTYGNWRPGDQPVYVSDTSKAREELGWQPAVDKERGVEQLYSWVMENRGVFSA